MERFELGKVDKATVVTDTQKETPAEETVEKESPEEDTSEPAEEKSTEEISQENPTQALTKEPPSKQNSEQEKMQPEKPSVKEKLTNIKRELGLDGRNIIRTAEELTKKSDEVNVPHKAEKTKQEKER